MVPKYYEMVRATLVSLRKRGGVATNQEIEDDIVAEMNLSEEVAAELHGRGHRRRWATERPGRAHRSGRLAQSSRPQDRRRDEAYGR